jgi:transcription antitermination factor NusA-like protein
MATIDMQTMRFMNLLDRVAHVRATKCFTYNNTVYFAVHPTAFAKALGHESRNVRFISEQLGKRIRIIRDIDNSPEQMRTFIASIVSPAEFENFEEKDGQFMITAGSRERAATLIGRNKVRLLELNEIMNSYFGKQVKIV